MTAVIQKMKTWRLFQRPEHFHLSSWLEVIVWWELRRIPFNLIVGVAGILTVFTLSALQMKFTNYFILPPGGAPFVLFEIVFYGIAANICYTAGWIVELASRLVWKDYTRHLGKISFAAGLIFSVLLTLSPINLFVGTALMQLAGIY